MAATSPAHLIEDISLAELDRDPYPAYRRLRRAAPVAKIASAGVWSRGPVPTGASLQAKQAKSVTRRFSARSFRPPGTRASFSGRESLARAVSRRAVAAY